MRHVDQHAPGALDKWREVAIREQGYPILAIGVLPVAYLFFHHLAAGRLATSALTALFLVAVPVVVLGRTTSARAQGWALVVLYFSAGVGALASLGVVDGGAIALVCAAVVATLQLGPRKGWLVLGVGIAALAAVGALQVAGVIDPFEVRSAADPTVPANWLRYGSFFLLCGGSVMVMVTSLTRKVEEELDGSSRLVEGLKREIEEREAAEVGRALAEARLAQAQKMEAIGLLASGVAHDFNNVLAAIHGHAEEARARLGGDEAVEGILEASHRARELVERLLAFAREEDDTHEDLDLSALAEETTRLVRASLPRTIAVDLRLPKEPAVVYGSPAGLSELLVNLCTNAGQAMPEGGRLDVQLAVEEEQLVLTVQDTGVGMDEETLARVFEPYFTRRVGGGGTGLGMAVVLGVVQRHMGLIRLESAAGKGTTVTVRLPRSSEDAALSLPPRVWAALPAGLRVLLVDDDRLVRRAMTALLRSMDVEVLAAEGGERALEVLATGLVDVVITDATMPGMSGLELVARLRRDYGGLPVVMCSGNVGALPEDELAALRVREVCQKPVAGADIRWSILQALEAARPRADAPQAGPLDLPVDLAGLDLA